MAQIHEQTHEQAQTEYSFSMLPLRVSTQHSPLSIPDAGESSPRTRVAENLRRLHLEYDQTGHLSELGSPSRKRMRLQPTHSRQSSIGELHGENVVWNYHPNMTNQVKPGSNTSPSFEILNRPLIHVDGATHVEDMKILTTTSAQTSSNRARYPAREQTPPDSPSRAQTLKRARDSAATGSAGERDHSLLTPDSPDSLPASVRERGPSDHQPSAYHGGNSPTTGRKALTWQDDEITGHLIDENSPYDDGEGINGLGFRPTPSIAYARSRRRQQQINEWKSREAREARQKRLERRRDPSTNHKNVARKVRFG